MVVRIAQIDGAPAPGAAVPAEQPRRDYLFSAAFAPSDDYLLTSTDKGEVRVYRAPNLEKGDNPTQWERS